MMINSWLHLKTQDSKLTLSSDLALSDKFNARDCGWVEQMRPFIREFTEPGEIILDPFSGFASTLVASSLESRKSIGIEIEEARYTIAKKRLDSLNIENAELILGDCNEVSKGLPAVDLILTSMPYFGCSLESKQKDQLYSFENYGQFLDQMRNIFKTLKPILKKDGYIIVMSENVRIGDQFVPQAWDAARLLMERFNFIDERVLIYDKPSSPSKTHLSNRAHEYALIAKNSAKVIDTTTADTLIKELQSQFPDLLVIGSYAKWLVNKKEKPSDVDLLIPFDKDQISGVLKFLENRKFKITRWGAPLKNELTEIASDECNYFRAERLEFGGGYLLFDLSFTDSNNLYEIYSENTINIHSINCSTSKLPLD